MKVTTTVYRRVVLVSHSHHSDMPPRKFQLPVEIKFLAESHLAAYQQFRPDQSAAEIRARLLRGDRCVCCWHKDQIVDAGWLAVGCVHVPYLNRYLYLNQDDIYHYDSYTDPLYRGYGLYPARTRFVERYTYSEGYRRALGMIAVENKAPLRIMLRHGGQAIAYYHCLRFGVGQLVWQRATPEAPLLLKKATEKGV